MDNLNEKESCSNSVLRNAAFFAMAGAGFINIQQDGEVRASEMAKFESFWRKFDDSVQIDFENRRQQLAKRILEERDASDKAEATEKPSGCGLCVFAFLAGFFAMTLLRLVANLIGLS